MMDYSNGIVGILFYTTAIIILLVIILRDKQKKRTNVLLLWISMLALIVLGKVLFF